MTRDFNFRSVGVPSHVVFRAFATETVVLNLKTGLYHGLNPTAGRILEVLSEDGSLDAAAERIAAEYEVPVDTVRDDVAELVQELVTRDLLEPGGTAAGAE